MSLSSIGRLLQIIGVCLLIVAVAVRAADLMDHQVNKSNQSTNSLVFYSSSNSNGSDSRPRPHRIKINRKRCRYSEQEIEEMNSRNLKRLSSSASAVSSSSNNGEGVGYYNTRDSGNDAASVGRINSKHQPKVRDQFHMRYGDAS